MEKFKQALWCTKDPESQTSCAGATIPPLSEELWISGFVENYSMALSTGLDLEKSSYFGCFRCANLDIPHFRSLCPWVTQGVPSKSGYTQLESSYGTPSWACSLKASLYKQTHSRQDEHIRVAQHAPVGKRQMCALSSKLMFGCRPAAFQLKT